MSVPWITVNREGLANTLSEIERFRILFELVQNALDTSAKKITVILSKPHYGYSTITVEDDDPKGFEDLKFAHEMFSDTSKRSDPTKAGRFTIGEKRFLSLCRKASIESTTGAVSFELVNGKEHRHTSSKKRATGTLVSGELQMTEEQYDAACVAMQSLMPPGDVEVTFNGQRIAFREPLKRFEAKLQTEFADSDRKMVKRERDTEVFVYDPLPNEVPHLYELGIPVVEIECKWHIDVRQRVPLNCDRDNVTPLYKRKLLALVLNETHDLLSEEDAAKPWIKEARSSDLITEPAFKSTTDKIFGEKAVIADPSDPESVSTAVANDYTVVRGKMMTQEEYENNRRFHTIPSSGRQFPTPRPYGPGGKPSELVPENEWTQGMKLVFDYTKALAKKLLGSGLSVRMVRTIDGSATGFNACFGRESGPFKSPQFDYFVSNLGEEWFAKGITQEVDSLIIHEFGHFYESNHLSDGYFGALSDLAAKIKRLALDDPKFFEEFERDSKSLREKGKI